MNKRFLLVTILLTAAIALCFGLPKPRYTSLDILPALNIPVEFGDWKSKDISGKLDLQGEQYNFINNVFARVYSNSQGRELLLLILDAGNFHNPKVCYGATGFTASDLPDTGLNVSGRQFKAATVYLSKNNTNLVLTYWLCINKKLVGWTGQKIQEFFYSLLNKKKAGLMVRVDVPTFPNDKDNAVRLAQAFIAELSKELSGQDIEYIFGK